MVSYGYSAEQIGNFTIHVHVHCNQWHNLPSFFSKMVM